MTSREDIKTDLLRMADRMDTTDRGWTVGGDGGGSQCTSLEAMNDRDMHSMIGLVMVIAISLLQLHRLLVAVVSFNHLRITGEHLAREFTIFILAMAGVSVFWRDIGRCAPYEGALKLVALVGFANLLLPCLWIVPPPPPPEDDNHDHGQQ